ncbi:MAG: hypothetical protein LBT26_05550 [Clostridiales Family XIII bacterium]|jgi:anti-sigma28 factor (negative regulator of flagellin synthesis)|nr:hypothetical protein [Clostridiales Family XIII bacterium]
MEISLLTKTKAVQPQPSQDAPRAVRSEESDRPASKSKVDSAEISGSHAGNFEDKRLSVAKSALLYETSAPAPEQRIGELKGQVERNAYAVSDEDLADVLLD